MSNVKIESALISVYDKSGLDDIVNELSRLGVRIISTGGTLEYINKLDVEAESVESLTSYPSILEGRVKTLHPKIFGGILARREKAHMAELEEYAIPSVDLVIVDLYPFEETVKNTKDEKAIIEKIDIGGISLIRAAAKNYRDVLVVASRNDYSDFLKILTDGEGETTLAQRRTMAKRAFGVSSHYDTAIYNYFASTANGDSEEAFRVSETIVKSLRYGENPHQKAAYFGDLTSLFEQRQGKELSFNNLVDVDGAVQLMKEFMKSPPTFAILKHTNACGVATRKTIKEAWDAALACDPVSAFGGILISNMPIDHATAEGIDSIFYEVLIAPAFEDDAVELLAKKKKRILLELKDYPSADHSYKSILNGVIRQETDRLTEDTGDLKTVTKKSATGPELADLIFANKCVKHLKSNAIVLVKDLQMVGMGCGQTSRVDALKQAVMKAEAFGFDLKGSVMASDAFFPFADSVEIAHDAGVSAVIQPGGSIKDQESIDFCDANNMSMVFTGNRHFKH